MPRVEVYRPNRSQPRYFTACSVARAARNCVRDTNTTNEEVMRCVAKALGYEKVLLKNNGRILWKGMLFNIIFQGWDAVGLSNQTAEQQKQMLADAAQEKPWLYGYLSVLLGADQNNFMPDGTVPSVEPTWVIGVVKWAFDKLRMLLNLAPWLQAIVQTLLDLLQDYDVISIADTEEDESLTKNCKCRMFTFSDQTQEEAATIKKQKRLKK